MLTTPRYLAGRATAFRANPREANRAWFRQAGYGLFLHYGLYSLLERHEWVQLRERIPVAEYERLADRFTAQAFDAAAIAQRARRWGMRYITLTTRHHDGFCLWRSAHTDFHSGNTPAARDLVAELAAACEDEALGFFLYYSHGRDWRHPHAPNNDEWGGQARPVYDPPEPRFLRPRSAGTRYATGAAHDLAQYLNFMRAQIAELFARFPQTAGIWLDGVAVPLSLPDGAARMRVAELYAAIRQQSPHALIAYKQGLLGTEDFFTPEHRLPDSGDSAEKRGQIEAHPATLVELNTTMLVDPIAWGANAASRHRSADEVLALRRRAQAAGANLLLNCAPLPDGRLAPQDIAALDEVARRWSLGK